LLVVKDVRRSVRDLFYGSIQEFSRKEWGKLLEIWIPSRPKSEQGTSRMRSRNGNCDDRAKSLFFFPLDRGDLRTNVHRIVESVITY
jgi:hypothetical protein